MSKLRICVYFRSWLGTGRPPCLRIVHKKGLAAFHKMIIEENEKMHLLMS